MIGPILYLYFFLTTGSRYFYRLMYEFSMHEFLG